MKAFLHKVPEELEQRILAEVRTEQGASRIALKELIDDYSFVPVVIKKDRNKSEKVYQVLTTQSAPAIEREQILAQMRGANAKLHVNKLVTLVAIKLEEKCQSIGHGYRMFDKNGDDLISRDEFKRGLDRLKIKFSEQDTELIFSHLDQDGDGKLNYHEFGSLQKRPIYFPAENPYEQQSESMPSLPSFQRPRSMDFEQLERVAGKMNIIGKTARKNSMKRRGTIPKSYL